MPNFILRPLTPADRQWVARRIAESWGAETVVVHRRPIGGTVFRPAELPGFVAEVGEEIVGLLTYHIEGRACRRPTRRDCHAGFLARERRGGYRAHRSRPRQRD